MNQSWTVPENPNCVSPFVPSVHSLWFQLIRADFSINVSHWATSEKRLLHKESLAANKTFKHQVESFEASRRSWMYPSVGLVARQTVRRLQLERKRKHKDRFCSDGWRRIRTKVTAAEISISRYSAEKREQTLEYLVFKSLNYGLIKNFQLLQKHIFKWEKSVF